MRRWRERGDVEKAQLYTRGTLYVMLCLGPLVIAPDYLATTSHRPALLGASVVGFLLTAAAGMVALRAAMDLYPDVGPVPWARVLPMLVAVGIGTCLALLAPGDPGLALLIVLSMMTSWSLGGFRDRRIAAGVVAGSALIPFLSDFALDVALVGGGIALFFVVTIRTSLWMLRIIVELDQARGVQAALAVAEERLRFSRDVHDVVGRRLSTVAVQAELGAALASRGDARAAEQMLEVRSTAHDTLREVRELARGYRTVDLAQELDGARSLLRSAGIDMTVQVETLPDAWHEAAAWVVRESVTNVLRHSTASRVSVTYDAHELRVSNDGAASTPPDTGLGAGLVGLRERLTPLGATLGCTHEGGSFELVAVFPGAPVPGRSAAVSA